MNLQKFTEKAQEAVLTARQIAEDNSNSQIEPLHLLLALVEQREGVVPGVLTKLGVQPQALAGRVEEEVGRLPKVQGSGVQVFVSGALSDVARRAERAAEGMRDEYVSAEHLLLAMSDDADKSSAGKLIREAGITRDKILSVLTQIRGNQRVIDQNPEAKYAALEKYSRDLTELARQNKLDPVIGRDEEIRRVIQVLLRRT